MSYEEANKVKGPLSSFKYRLIIVFCLVSILPLIMINLISYYNTTNIVRDNTDELTEVNLVQTGKSVKSTLATYEDLLFQLYTDDDIVRCMDKLNAGEDKAVTTNQLRRTLRGIANIKDYIQGITIITKSGDVVFYDKLTASTIKTSWMETVGMTSEELYEKISVEQDVQYITTRFASDFSVTPYYLFHLAHKAVDYNSIHRKIGIIIMSIDERLLNEICNQNEQGDGGTLPGNLNFIIDNDGHLVTFPDQRQIEGVSFPVPDPTGAWKDDYSRIFQKIGILSGNDYALHSLYDERLGWSFINISDQSVVIRQIETQRNMMFMVIFLSVAFIIALIVLITHHMTSSIASIVKAMKKAGKGDLTVRVQPGKNMPSEIETITKQFNRMMGQMNGLMEEVKTVSERQKDAQIIALEAQINPHFLYNTLDTINWMSIDAEQYEISNAIGALARILRYGIDKSNGIVTIKEEVDWLKQYIFLQQTRLKNMFSCRIDVPKEFMSCKIHKLLFQPFVENAILHGFEGVKRHHVLTIEIREEPKEFLTITVTDNGKGIEPEKIEELKRGLLPQGGDKSHIGMNNAIERLKMYYGDGAAFNIESQFGAGTTVTIQIPKM